MRSRKLKIEYVIVFLILLMLAISCIVFAMNRTGGSSQGNRADSIFVFIEPDFHETYENLVEDVIELEDGVELVEYISPEEAYQDYSRYISEDGYLSEGQERVLDSFDEKMLPASYEFSVLEDTKKDFCRNLEVRFENVDAIRLVGCN